MSKSIREFWRLLTIVVAAALGMSSAVWAGELGYGFAPGLTAGTDYVAGQLIVGYQDDAAPDELLKAAQATGWTVQKTLPGPGEAALLSFESEAQAVAAIPALLNQPGVQFVERNGLVRVSPPLLTLPAKRGFNGTVEPALESVIPNAVSTDPGTGFQWHLPVIRKTALPPTLALKPPTVAVIDSGVDYTHPDLASRVIRGKNTILNNLYPFDDYGQGTHVAGLIAAQAGNKIDGEGVCPNCKILAIKVLNAGGVGTAFDIADGLE
nr:S8 family serine peptidase [Candidatus Contendobacter sp.]